MKKDLTFDRVVVVYKHSRLSYAKERATIKEQAFLAKKDEIIIQEMHHAHEKNLACIEAVISTLEQCKINFTLLCRSDLSQELLHDALVIAVGGDGTVLDTSHYCSDAPLLGVNSDPKTSIGALCCASIDNFYSIIKAIFEEGLQPIHLWRLEVFIDGEKTWPLALNDVLFCHRNPAAMSRFALAVHKKNESFRSSGVWVASAVGSSGGIFSAGGKVIPLDLHQALFHVREPYWVSAQKPKLLSGVLSPGDELFIQSSMPDGEVFIDGPHKSIPVNFGASIKIRLAKESLKFFSNEQLIHNRLKLIQQREAIRNL